MSWNDTTGAVMGVVGAGAVCAKAMVVNKRLMKMRRTVSSCLIMLCDPREGRDCEEAVITRPKAVVIYSSD